jgi:hypothetical protein
MARASLKVPSGIGVRSPSLDRGILLDRIGLVGEDSGFDSLQLRFSFCLPHFSFCSVV